VPGEARIQLYLQKLPQKRDPDRTSGRLSKFAFEGYGIWKSRCSRAQKRKAHQHIDIQTIFVLVEMTDEHGIARM
jgi:hypothetical protein